MVGRFEVLNQYFATHRESFFDSSGGFFARQGIPPERVTGVSQFDGKPRFEITRQLRWQRAVGIEPL